VAYFSVGHDVIRPDQVKVVDFLTRDKLVDLIDPGEAKQIAKCIVEALLDAGLQIAPLDKAS